VLLACAVWLVLLALTRRWGIRGEPRLAGLAGGGRAAR
jgi:hypothetical protein